MCVDHVPTIAPLAYGRGLPASSRKFPEVVGELWKQLGSAPIACFDALLTPHDLQPLGGGYNDWNGNPGRSRMSRTAKRQAQELPWRVRIAIEQAWRGSEQRLNGEKPKRPDRPNGERDEGKGRPGGHSPGKPFPSVQDSCGRCRPYRPSSWAIPSILSAVPPSRLSGRFGFSPFNRRTDPVQPSASRSVRCETGFSLGSGRPRMWICSTGPGMTDWSQPHLRRSALSDRHRVCPQLNPRRGLTPIAATA